MAPVCAREGQEDLSAACVWALLASCRQLRLRPPREAARGRLMEIGLDSRPRAACPLPCILTIATWQSDHMASAAASRPPLCPSRTRSLHIPGASPRASLLLAPSLRPPTTLAWRPAPLLPTKHASPPSTHTRRGLAAGIAAAGAVFATSHDPVMAPPTHPSTHQYTQGPRRGHRRGGRCLCDLPRPRDGGGRARGDGGGGRRAGRAPHGLHRCAARVFVCACVCSVCMSCVCV